MPLLAINKKATPTIIAGTSVTLPAASSDGAHGQADNVSAELQNLTEAQYQAIMTQAQNDELTTRWSNGGPEFQTGPLIVGYENHNLYCDLAGNDLNPGTATQKWATVDRALSFISQLGTHLGRLRLNLSGSTFPVTGGRRFQLSQPKGKLGTPLFITGTQTDELGTITASAFNLNALILTIAGAVPGAADDYFGYTLRATSGANAGQRRMITANTAGAGPNTFTVNEQFSFDSINIGDTFVVEKYATQLQLPNPFAIFNLSQGQIIGMKYLSVQGNLGWFGTSLYASSVEINGSGLSRDGAQLIAASSGTPWNADGGQNPLPFSSFPAGLFLRNGTLEALGDAAIIDSYICLRDARTVQGGKAIVRALNQKNSTWLALGGAQFSHSGPFNLDFGTFLPIPESSPAKSDGVSASVNGAGQFMFMKGAVVDGFNGLELVNAPADAVVNDGAKVNVGQTANSSAGFGEFRPWVVGSSAAGVGHAVRQQGEAEHQLFQAASGAAASTTAGGGFSGLTGAGLASGPNVGDLLEISGAAIAGNNRVYKIATVVSATEVTTTPAPTNPDGNDGAIAWKVFNATHFSGVGGDLRLGGHLDSSFAQIGGVIKTLTEAATPDANANRGVTDNAGNRASAVEADLGLF